MLKLCQISFLLKIYQFTEKHLWMGKISFTCKSPFYEDKICTFRLVFPLMLFGEAWIHSDFNYYGNISCKRYPIKYSWQNLGRWSLISSKSFSLKRNDNLMEFSAFSNVILIHLFDLIKVAFVQSINYTKLFKIAKCLGILRQHSLTPGQAQSKFELMQIWL